MINQVATLPLDLASTTATAVKLTVVAPTYNERDNITPLVQALERSLCGINYEILICDDDSPDLTWAHAQAIAASHERVRVLRRTTDRGLSAAVVDGFSAARGEVVACMDADLQHDPAILPRMLRALDDGAQLVVGSRYVAGGACAHWSWHRRFTSWTATQMAAWLLGLKLRDPMSGFFLLRRADFRRVRPQLQTSGFKILLEICAHLRPERICEIPYTFRTRVAGKSKLSSRVMLAYAGQLWRLRRLPLAAEVAARSTSAPEIEVAAEARRAA